jgi:hypothetical protein
MAKMLLVVVHSNASASTLPLLGRKRKRGEASGLRPSMGDESLQVCKCASVWAYEGFTLTPALSNPMLAVHASRPTAKSTWQA